MYLSFQNLLKLILLLVSAAPDLLTSVDTRYLPS